MQNFFYVYILTSEDDPTRHYIGFTEDLEQRVKAHNAGQVPYTNKYKPWRFETVIAFRSRDKAVAFEKYLKSHSGRSFSTRHL
jgi:putative endonuclease